MHLGRGGVKAFRGYVDEAKSSVQEWITYAEQYVLQNRICRMSNDDRNDLHYSLRRYFVDSFYQRTVSALNTQSFILDLGGKKKKKRGRFNIEDYEHHVEYVNLDKSTDPDYCADVISVPVNSGRYDAVICAETLEHIYDVNKVLSEAFRLLKPGGIFLVTVPFNMQIHPDPKDYARYTDSYLLESLQKDGFVQIHIEKQGYILCVMSDMVTGYVQRYKTDSLSSRVFYRMIHMIAVGLRHVALAVESKSHLKYSTYVTSYTTGYGIIAEKPL
jgi:ubiquinone/menaquinone biosynthesis C-methylase UbiE